MQLRGLPGTCLYQEKLFSLPESFISKPKLKKGNGQHVGPILLFLIFYPFQALGILYLIPVTLGGNDYHQVIPEKVLTITRSLRHFIVEDIRSARRYLRLIDRGFPIDSCMFMELNEHTGISEIENYLNPLLQGRDAGLMSEAGLPGIADPGAALVALAHRKEIRVVPLSGPSSVILAIISSGLNGQNFTFNGYLPKRSTERASRLKELERNSRDGYAQVFIETPYRNMQMLETILRVCQPDTRLCIASDITLPGESINTLKISAWKKNVPDLKGKMSVFIIQS